MASLIEEPLYFGAAVAVDDVDIAGATAIVAFALFYVTSGYTIYKSLEVCSISDLISISLWVIF